MQEYWSGLSFPPPGDFPDRGMGPCLLSLLSLLHGLVGSCIAPPGKNMIKGRDSLTDNLLRKAICAGAVAFSRLIPSNKWSLPTWKWHSLWPFAVFAVFSAWTQAFSPLTSKMLTSDPCFRIPAQGSPYSRIPCPPLSFASLWRSLALLYHYVSSLLP